MIFGYHTLGASTLTLPTNTKRVTRTHVLVPCQIVKLTAAIDGLGSGGASQVVKGVVYDTSGSLIATSSEVTIAAGAPLAWVDFSFLSSSPSGVSLTATQYDFGLISGATSNGARVHYDDVGTGQSNADTYSDGPAATFGASTADSHAYTLFATAKHVFSPPDVTDEDLADLPFTDAENALWTPPVVSTAQGATVGWHGTFQDDRTGPYALVRPDGPLAGSVGERVQVAYDERSVNVYVTDTSPILEDISLTRRAFMRIAQPNTEELSAIVTILSQS